MLKVNQAAFVSEACYIDIHKYLGHLQMATYPLDKQTASCDSPHDWLVNLAMDLPALCDMWK